MSSSSTATNIVQNPTFDASTADLSPWVGTGGDQGNGGFGPGSNDGVTHAYCFSDSCGTLAQPLTLTAGHTYRVSYAGYCLSQENTEADECSAVVGIGTQAYNDSLLYATADQPPPWPAISHDIGYNDGDQQIFFTVALVGSQAIYRMTNASVLDITPASSTSSSGTSSSQSSHSSSSSSGGAAAGTQSTGTPTPTPSGGGGGGSHNTTAIAVGASLGAVVALLGVAFAVFWFRRRRAWSPDPSGEGQEGMMVIPSPPVTTSPGSQPHGTGTPMSQRDWTSAPSFAGPGYWPNAPSSTAGYSTGSSRPVPELQSMTPRPPSTAAGATAGHSSARSIDEPDRYSIYQGR